jgi:hypothetical protein
LSDVINPDEIPIPQVLPEALETAAQAIKADGEQLARLGHDIDSDWQRLSSFYHAPEANLLFAKIHPVAAAGDSLEGPTKTVSTALTTFAETARSLVADLKGLHSKASAFRDKINGDDDWREDEDKVKEHNALNNDVFAKLVAYQTAERDCANKITGLFGGTHFIGTDPTASSQWVDRGEEVYGLTRSVDDVETPWAKPQKYDAPWYEDTWNGIKDFGVGLAQDLSSLVGMYGEDGWGWQGWGGLGESWASLDEGLAGLVGFYGPNGWGWQGWDGLGHNWNNLVKAFVPYQEWDGGNGAFYVITQSILNIGSIFVGAGAVKGAIKGLSATRGAEFAEAAGAASKAGVVGRAFTDGFKSAFELPSVADLEARLNSIKSKFGDLRGLGKSIKETFHFGKAPDTNLPDHEPAHVGGHDPNHGTTDPGGSDHAGGSDHHGGSDGGTTDPGGSNHGDTDHRGTDDGGTDSDGQQAPNGSGDHATSKPPWPVADEVQGSAHGKSLSPPHPRHTIEGARNGMIRPKNSVFLRGFEADINKDVAQIAEGKARWNPQTNRYEINGRSYGVEPSGRVYPDSGVGIVNLDRNEYAALKALAKAGGDPAKVPAFSRDPRFINNPGAIEKAKAIYDGSYKP